MEQMRYYSAGRYYRAVFGRPMQKAALDAGCTCPNLDGTCGTKGCIFCDGGSGTFTHSGSITRQLEQEARRISAAHPEAGILAYFQAHTNTYGDPDFLRVCYAEALQFPNVEGLAIGTRPDCLPEPILKLLEDFSHRTYLTVELGLQTVHDHTARKIGRGYPFSVFLQAMEKLRSRNIRICVHLINGLPGESDQDMLETARILGQLRPDAVKIHLLHILKGTPLEQLWRQGGVAPLSFAEYAQITAAQLAFLPESVVIERLTGDGDSKKLLAPLWSRDKHAVRNAISRYQKQTDSWQGKYALRDDSAISKEQSRKNT